MAPAGIGAETPGLVELGDAVAHGLDDAPAPEQGAQTHGRVAGEHHPVGHRLAGVGHAGGDEQHPDDADRLLGIVTAVAQAVGRGRQQLEAAESLVHTGAAEFFGKARRRRP